MNHLFLGTSGYTYKDWKDIFYTNIPQKDWLLYYSLYFNSVEINATFYRDFPKSVFMKWAEQTDDTFTFVLKGPRMITHYKKLLAVEENVRFFFDHASGLQNKLQAVLWQFPGNFLYTTENMQKLRRFLPSLPENYKQIYEFRHTSWFREEVYTELEKWKTGLVINDSDAFPSIEKTISNITYIRFHGPDKLYASSYSYAELQQWAEKIRQYLRNNQVFVYFNNDINGYALQNAFTLKDLLAAK